MEQLYAKKGEWVTCENGHKICQVKEDILIGSISNGGELIKWKQKKPTTGENVPLCVKCNGEFYINNNTLMASPSIYPKYKPGIHMHFKEGWR